MRPERVCTRKSLAGRNWERRDGGEFCLCRLSNEQGVCVRWKEMACCSKPHICTAAVVLVAVAAFWRGAVVSRSRPCGDFRLVDELDNNQGVWLAGWRASWPASAGLDGFLIAVAVK